MLQRAQTPKNIINCWYPSNHDPSLYPYKYNHLRTVFSIMKLKIFEAVGTEKKHQLSKPHSYSCNYFHSSSRHLLLPAICLAFCLMVLSWCCEALSRCSTLPGASPHAAGRCSGCARQACGARSCPEGIASCIWPCVWLPFWLPCDSRVALRAGPTQRRQPPHWTRAAKEGELEWPHHDGAYCHSFHT